MELKKTIKDFISLGAICYTALSTVIIIIAMALSSDNASKLLSPKQFLFLLLFCYLMSLGTAIKKITAMPKVAAYAAHAVCYVGGFALFLILCGVKFVPVVIASLIFAIIYATVSVIQGLSDKRKYTAGSQKNAVIKNTAASAKTKRKKSKKDMEYVNQFSSPSNKA